MYLTLTSLIGYGVVYTCVGVIIGFMFAVLGGWSYEPREDSFYEMEEEDEINQKKTR